jgi:hypothetical protein
MSFDNFLNYGITPASIISYSKSSEESLFLNCISTFLSQSVPSPVFFLEAMFKLEFLNNIQCIKNTIRFIRAGKAKQTCLSNCSKCLIQLMDFIMHFSNVKVSDEIYKYLADCIVSAPSKSNRFIISFRVENQTIILIYDTDIITLKRRLSISVGKQKKLNFSQIHHLMNLYSIYKPIRFQGFLNSEEQKNTGNYYIDTVVQKAIDDDSTINSFIEGINLLNKISRDDIKKRLFKEQVLN